MKKAEFIKMLQQDNETQSEPKKSLHAQVIDCTIIALLDETADFEIDATVTADNLFKLIEQKAKESLAISSSVKASPGTPAKTSCVGPFEAAKLIAEHLNTKNDGVARLYNMVMGMAEGNAPTPRKSRISLDDL